MRRKLFSEDNIIRRKLFSNNEPTRRKLFSDETKPLPETEGKVVKCMDCGQTYKYDGSDLHIICTRCGSDRFEFLENISNPDEITPGDLNPIDKVFSEKRRKLFCNDGGTLTHDVPGPVKVTFACPDCGTTFRSQEQYVDGAVCPNCGGRRCRVVGNDVGGVSNEEGQSVEEENAFSDLTGDELDEVLSRYKGRLVDEEELNAELHALGVYDEVGGVNGLVDSGYAKWDKDGQLMFSEVADFQRKLFSKLVISVTKELDIDPIINRESAIDSLAEKFPGKPIMILKRAQSSIAPEVTSFSDKSYLKDSGIESDIKVGYGGQTMTIKDFMNLLNEEYPDAPEEIIDLLESSKAIKVNGGKVLISK